MPLKPHGGAWIAITDLLPWGQDPDDTVYHLDLTAANLEYLDANYGGVLIKELLDLEADVRPAAAVEVGTIAEARVRPDRQPDQRADARVDDVEALALEGCATVAELGLVGAAETGRIDVPPATVTEFELRVIAGPDTGRSLAVDANEPAPVVVGQSPVCALRLGDPEVQRVLDRLKQVPVDISPRYLTAQKLLASWTPSHARFSGGSVRISLISVRTISSPEAPLLVLLAACIEQNFVRPGEGAGVSV